jgi:hypothetical protein
VDLERFTADELAICARLSGSRDQLDELRIDVARRHGVHLVLAGTLTSHELATGWGRELLRELRTAAAFQVRRDDLLRGLLDALSADGILPLVLKGAALAHTLYDQPWERPAADIDLLIDRADRERSETILRTDGWLRDPESNAELASTQRHYSKTLPSGRTEFVDLHWKIANPPLFADVLAYGDLASRAVPIGVLGSGARTAAEEDALLLACVHIAAHHAEQPRLVWLLDVHRLGERLTAAHEARFLSLVESRGMRAVTRYVLDAAARCFGGARVTALAEAIGTAPAVERSAQVLRPLSRAMLVRADLAALGSWRDRVALLREHLFPSTEYLRTVYPGWPTALLPVAALHRIVAGAPKWLRSPRR